MGQPVSLPHAPTASHTSGIPASSPLTLSPASTCGHGHAHLRPTHRGPLVSGKDPERHRGTSGHGRLKATSPPEPECEACPALLSPVSRGEGQHRGHRGQCLGQEAAPLHLRFTCTAGQEVPPCSGRSGECRTHDFCPSQGTWARWLHSRQLFRAGTMAPPPAPHSRQTRDWDPGRSREALGRGRLAWAQEAEGIPKGATLGKGV